MCNYMLTHAHPSKCRTIRLFHLTKESVMNQLITDKNVRHIPWNKGKLIGQKFPLKLKEIWAIRIRLQLANRTRELALFNLAIDSKLRACDLVQLRICDVTQGNRVSSRAMVMQQKTHRPVQFEITEQTHESLITNFDCLQCGCNLPFRDLIFRFTGCPEMADTGRPQSSKFDDCQWLLSLE